MIGAIIAPIFLVLFLFIWISALIPSCSLAELEMDNTPGYDATAIGDYADAQYAAAFGMSNDYEDHLLLVFLVDEDCYDYYYIAWLGDHIDRRVAELFGDNQTALGRALAASVNAQSYKYSLDSDLAAVFDHMAQQIDALGMESIYFCQSPDTSVTSHVVNHTALPLTEQTLNASLEKFTEQTGIPTVVVVEDMADVLGSEEGTAPASQQRIGITALFILVPIVIIVILIVKNVRTKKNPDAAQKDKWE